MVSLFKLEVIKKLIPDIEDITILKIEGKYFVFDKESLKEFNEYFNNDSYIVFLENGYLCRRPKWDKEISPRNFQFFHRFLIQDEILKRGKLSEVHHLTWCKRINIKKYLKLISKEEHETLHSSGLHDRKYMKESKWLEFVD